MVTTLGERRNKERELEVEVEKGQYGPKMKRGI